MTLGPRKAMTLLVTGVATLMVVTPAAAGVVPVDESTRSPYVSPTPSGSGADQPEEFLQRAARGRVAVERLGADLPEVAALNDLSARGLKRLLLEDPTAWVHSSGRVFFVDPAPNDITPVVPAEAPYPYAQTFQLHSRPGSTKTIYLDFDGHYVSGSLWNTDPRWSLPAQTHPAFSLDGDPTTFSDAERDVIQGVWQRVSEDYAPFDVDVTTADPGPAGLLRTSAGDQTFGTRALVTPSDPAVDALCGGGCGGVGFIGTFSDGADVYQPAWIFPQELGWDTKAIAEAASHEVGHNLGLQHDATATAGYYSGQGAWAPIMGGSYGRPISQWSRGEYAGADNFQDDLAVITENGLATVPDDHGDTSSGATTLTSADRTATGVVSTAADRDWFGLPQGCSGAVTVSVLPAPTSPNLDVQLRLRSGDGTLLATSNPASGVVSYDVASGLGASAQINATAGTTLYAEVDGVGSGDPLSNGYSDYASLGRYTISSTGCAAPPPAVIAFVEASRSVGEAAGTVDLTVTRTGNTTVPASVGYSRTGGTATPGTDFNLPAGTLSFDAGETTKTIPVTILDDSTEEPSETVQVTLGNPGSGTALGTITRSTLTITDDDAPAVVAFKSSSMSTVEAGGTVDLVVTRTGNTTRSSTVDYARTGGTATADTDFALVDGTLTFAAGQTQRTISLALAEDDLPEPDETVIVGLSSPSTGTVLGQASSSTVTITDDDEQATVGFERSQQTFDEDAGTVQVTVVRSGNTLLAASVDYERTGGTASPVSDLLGSSGTLTFAPGATERTVELTVVDDTMSESGETVQLTLTDPSSGTALGTSTTTVTIATSDQQPDATISTRPSAGYVGDGIVDVSGAGQTKTVTARPGQVRSFFVRVANDGTATNRILLFGGRPGRGASATYFSGGEDVTAILTDVDGSYVDLRPGQAMSIQVNIRIGRRTKVGSVKTVPVTATWIGDGVRTDVVKASVTVKR